MGKTKEMIIDIRRNQREYSGIEIKGETTERVKKVKMYRNNFYYQTVLEMSCICRCGRYGPQQVTLSEKALVL